MYTRLFGARRPPSNFQKSIELKPLAPLIQKLRAIVNELEKESKQPNALTITSQKFAILSTLLRELDCEIILFNSIDNLYTDNRKLANFTEKLKNLLFSVINSDKLNTLLVPRDYDRIALNHTLKGSACVLSLALMAVTPPAFLPTLACLSPLFAADAIGQITGVSDYKPKSAQIVIDLNNVIIKIHQNISQYLQETDETHHLLSKVRFKQ